MLEHKTLSLKLPNGDILEVTFNKVSKGTKEKEWVISLDALAKNIDSLTEDNLWLLTLSLESLNRDDTIILRDGHHLFRTEVL